MLDQIIKSLGIKIDPEKVNKLIEYVVTGLEEIKKNSGEQASALRDLVELKKEELNLLKKKEPKK